MQRMLPTFNFFEACQRLCFPVVSMVYQPEHQDGYRYGTDREGQVHRPEMRCNRLSRQVNIPELRQ